MRPDIEMIRRLIAYDPETGLLVWKERTERDAPNPKERKRWNGRYSGKPAFRTNQHGYLSGMVNRHSFRGHRIAWAIHHGTWPEGEIDHINGDRGDNRISNLRDVSKQVNCRNRKRSKANTSGVTGVVAHRGGFRAFISMSLGVFATLEEAAAARKKAEDALGFHPNHGRK